MMDEYNVEPPPRIEAMKPEPVPVVGGTPADPCENPNCPCRGALADVWISYRCPKCHAHLGITSRDCLNLCGFDKLTAAMLQGAIYMHGPERVGP